MPFRPLGYTLVLMADVPEVEAIGVESVVLTDRGNAVAIKLETATGFVTMQMPFQQAVDLLDALDAVVLPDEAAPGGKKATH